MVVIEILVLVLFFFLGASIASGVYCAAWRVKQGESWFTSKRSHCDYCGHTLSMSDLIPVIGYILLRGKCRYCGKEIPSSSFVYEIVFGLIFAATGHLIAASLWGNIL